jgi:uncharacterized phage-associated protein
MTYNVNDIANKILNCATTDDTQELISNLKLQKMLYYMQGYFLARFDSPLFNDDIEAWMYGPVVPSVYYMYSEHGKNGIEWNEVPINLTEEEEDLFTAVYDNYSIYSGSKLIDMSHNEPPWKDIDNAGRVGRGTVISKESLRDFFINKISY